MYFYISYKILFYFYFIKMCISGNSKYLDEHGGTILLKSPNPSYDTNLKDYLKKDNDLKITQITCRIVWIDRRYRIGWYIWCWVRLWVFLT